MALVNCPECGREQVSDSAVACPGCGYNIKEHFLRTSVTNSIQSFASEKQNISTPVIINPNTQFDEIKRYFGKVRDEYYYSEQCQKNIDKLKNHFFYKLETFGFIVFVIGLILGCFGAIIGFIAFFVGLVLWFIAHMATKKLNPQIEQLKEEKSTHEKIIKDHYTAYTNCPLSFEMTHPDVLRQLADYIRTSRANTLQEAIKLYHDEQYKLEMKQIAEETRDAQIATQKATESAARTAALNSLNNSLNYRVNRKNYELNKKNTKAVKSAIKKSSKK